jgi:phosphoglycerate dehydrogenase-like enzyme
LTPRSISVCICHDRLEAEFHDAVSSAFPDMAVSVIDETVVSPPFDPDVLVGFRFPAQLINECRRLRLLQLTSAGFDHIDVAAVPPGAVIATAGSLPARAVGEFVWMALLGLAKDAPTLVRQQAGRLWRLADARLVDGTTLVVVGLGAVGREVARRGHAFGVRVLGVTRTGRPDPCADAVYPASALADVAVLADHLVIAVPGGRATHQLVGRDVVDALPEGAALINVSRASVLDVTAVVDSLRAGRLGAALLDVHDPEPVPPESELWDVPRLWLTPHCAFRDHDEGSRLSALIVENLGHLLGGTPMRNALDREALLRTEVATATESRLTASQR